LHATGGNAEYKTRQDQIRVSTRIVIPSDCPGTASVDVVSLLPPTPSRNAAETRAEEKERGGLWNRSGYGRKRDDISDRGLRCWQKAD
jgi:hypothetical protein